MVRKNEMKKLVIIGMISILSCSLFAGQVQIKEKNITDYPIKSYLTASASCTYFNKEISNALSNKEQWPYQPLSIVLRYINSQLSAQNSHIIINYSKGEIPLDVQIDIYEHGFFDDSVSGEWKRFYLHKKDSDAPWYIKQIRTASLCARGKNQESFQKGFCP